MMQSNQLYVLFYVRRMNDLHLKNKSSHNDIYHLLPHLPHHYYHITLDHHYFFSNFYSFSTIIIIFTFSFFLPNYSFFSFFSLSGKKMKNTICNLYIDYRKLIIYVVCIQLFLLIDLFLIHKVYCLFFIQYMIYILLSKLKLFFFRLF